MPESTFVGPPPKAPVISLRVNDDAAVVGVGRDELFAAHRRSDLVFRCPTSRPVIEVTELERWIRSQPTEAPRRRAEH